MAPPSRPSVSSPPSARAPPGGGRLTAGLDVKLVYLRGSKELIAERLRHRTGHFAGEAILDDQFAVLEEPRNALAVDITVTAEHIAEEILRKIT